uniref:Polyketide synthase n=1 Tax=Peronospora matthiolae TaxID=2874970 RepID=A0AAV1TV61_9STRA
MICKVELPLELFYRQVASSLEARLDVRGSVGRVEAATYWSVTMWLSSVVDGCGQAATRFLGTHITAGSSVKSDVVSNHAIVQSTPPSLFLDQTASMCNDTRSACLGLSFSPTGDELEMLRLLKLYETNRLVN